ncbi:MAG: hypothetical protein JRI41_06900 [Deltaproteobacteria bacterium]|nr:hypothetical protein [Deltaproteobacteria bacterium]
MASQRQDILNALQSVIDNVSSITTTLLSNYEVDLTKYSSSSLPMALIIPTAETPLYETGQYAKWTLATRIIIYFLSEDSAAVEGEALVKDIKDVLGNNSTLNGNAIDISIGEITNGGNFPLFSVEFKVNITYERSILNA